MTSKADDLLARMNKAELACTIAQQELRSFERKVLEAKFALEDAEQERARVIEDFKKEAVMQPQGFRNG